MSKTIVISAGCFFFGAALVFVNRESVTIQGIVVSVGAGTFLIALGAELMNRHGLIARKAQKEASPRDLYGPH